MASGAQPFRRRGVVQARVLAVAADHVWRSSSGSWVRGRAGDWWVEGG